MRKKQAPPSFGVADGLNFDPDSADFQEDLIPDPPVESKSTKSRIVVDAEVDPNRNYSPYYVPKPKKGSRGGSLGRGAVSESERKTQFSLTCTPAQKQMYMEAAKKENRKLPNFICNAVEEYIERHGLK